MSKKASGLGRGLGALIPEAAQAAGVTRAGAAEIPLHQIKPNPYQPRRSFNESELAALAESIDRKSTRLNSSHVSESRMPSSA